MLTGIFLFIRFVAVKCCLVKCKRRLVLFLYSLSGCVYLERAVGKIDKLESFKLESLIGNWKD